MVQIRVRFRKTHAREVVSIFLASHAHNSAIFRMSQLGDDERDDGIRRGEPQIEQTIETHTIAHIFSFNSLDDIQVYENTTSFYVREDASEIVIYFKATFAGSDQIGQFGCNELVSRYVNARLINADGDVVWSENVCEDYNPMNTHLYPEPDFSTGEWTIDVEARGFGKNS